MQSASALVKGDAGALPAVVLHWLSRAALIGIGLAVMGERGGPLVKKSLAGAAVIEIFVLLYAAKDTKAKKK